MCIRDRSESSGVWTFPTTGKYQITYCGTGTGNSDRYIGVHIYVSEDGGSSYTYRGESYGSAYNSGSTTYTSFTLNTIIDVTNASQFRFYFRASSSGTVNFLGHTSAMINGFTVVRLGDT